jgi:hypothetical protein
MTSPGAYPPCCSKYADAFSHRMPPCGGRYVHCGHPGEMAISSFQAKHNIQSLSQAESACCLFILTVQNIATRRCPWQPPAPPAAEASPTRCGRSSFSAHAGNSENLPIGGATAPVKVPSADSKPLRVSSRSTSSAAMTSSQSSGETSTPLQQSSQGPAQPASQPASQPVSQSAIEQTDSRVGCDVGSDTGDSSHHGCCCDSCN